MFFYILINETIYLKYIIFHLFMLQTIKLKKKDT